MSATDMLHRAVPTHTCPLLRLPEVCFFDPPTARTHLPPFVALTYDVGDPHNTVSNQHHAKGLGTGTFENTQADQKVGYPNKVEASFLKAQVGNEKGK